MLYVVLEMAKFDKLKAVFQSIPLPLLIAVVVGYTAGQLLSSLKWYTIVKSAGIKTSYPAALRAYFIGMYLNCFGLGTIGGDVARGLLIAEGQNKKATALSSVEADRLHGLAVLSGIGAVAALCFGVHALDPMLVAVLVSIGAGVALGWLIAPPLLMKILPPSNNLRAKIQLILEAFPRTPSVIIKITTISLVFHTLQIALHWVMGLAVGVELSFTFLLVTIPFVNILGTLPISWNGLGVRERAYVFFLVPATLNAEHAVAFGAMWLLSVTTASAIGGIVAVLTKDFGDLSKLKDEARELAPETPAR